MSSTTVTPERSGFSVSEYIVCLNDRAKTTRDVCGLDREDLRDERRIWLIMVGLAIELYKKPPAEGKREKYEAILRGSVSPSSRYSAMVRAKLLKSGINPDRLS